MDRDILVLTVTLGKRDSIKQTIDSVRRIGGERVRHVVIAPEETIPILAKQYPDAEWVAEPADSKGFYHTLNYGLKTYGKQYKYLTFLNDDDFWLDDYSLLIDAISNNKDLDLVYGKTRFVNENRVKINSQACSSQFNDFIKLLGQGIILMTQQAAIIRSSLYFRIGGFDESYRLAADTKFWAEASALGCKYRYIAREVAAYRIQKGQLSSDHELQYSEHARILTEISNGSKGGFLAAMRFRLSNIDTYLKRALRFKGYRKRPATGRVKQGLTVLLPWKLRRYVLNKYFLYDIAPTAHIGLSFIYPRFLRMDEGASIGHLNVAINLDRMEMGENAIISRSNWITGFPTGTDSPHFAHDLERCSELIMGRESSMTKNHHIDCTNRVSLGDFAAIGGYGTQILTHSVDMMECRQDSHPISIGKYSLVATRCIITGGAQLPSYSVLCAGAYLGKVYVDEWKMYAGVPARPIKDIPKEAKRFHREKGYII